MKFTLLVFFLLASSVFVSAQNDVKLEINSKLPARYTKDTRNLIATAAAAMFPFVKLTIKKIEYTIAFDGKNRKIKSIFTDDEKFVDANGRMVDEEITVEWEDIEVLGYFQLRTKPDKNGWQAVIGGFSAFEGDFLERVQKAGHLTTTIDSFAKGYNY